MTTLYVTEAYSVIKKEGDTLVISIPADDKDGRAARKVEVPAIKVSEVVVLGDSTFTSQALAESDLLIVSRDPGLLQPQNQAKKRVLWMHDIATHRGYKRAIQGIGWSFDEIWTVSEWHRKQVAEVTGYPLSHIFALRNGIVPIKIENSMRVPNTLCYAARPERGLANLVRDKGIMSHLEDYNLLLSTYGNYPKDMHNFYVWINEQISHRKNVGIPEELAQLQMRQRLADVDVLAVRVGVPLHPDLGADARAS